MFLLFGSVSIERQAFSAISSFFHLTVSPGRLSKGGLPKVKENPAQKQRSANEVCLPVCLFD